MKRNLIPAVVLIAIGLLFLAQNLGWTNLSLARLIGTCWPAILIVVGVGMLFSRSSSR